LCWYAGASFDANSKQKGINMALLEDVKALENEKQSIIAMHQIELDGI
jgi:hypothetical protein